MAQEKKQQGTSEKEVRPAIDPRDDAQASRDKSVPNPGPLLADFSRFRLTQDFPAIARVEQVHATVPVRRPNKAEFVRTRPGATEQLLTTTLEWGDQREVYLLAPELCAQLPELATIAVPTVLRVAITLDGIEFIWPLRLPDSLRPNRWHVAAFEAAKIAESRWLRVVANMALGTYDLYAAKDALSEPRWSTRSLDALLEAAFRDHIISDVNHAIVKALLGQNL